MKPNILSQLMRSTLVVAAAAMFVAGCSSEDDTVAVADDGLPDDPQVPTDPVIPDPTDPVIADPPPAGTINGLWTGSLSRVTNREAVFYTGTMLLNRVVSDTFDVRGNTVGVALGDGPDSKDALTEFPHFLFEGGFTFSTVSVTNTADPDDNDLTAGEEIVCEVPSADSDGDGEPDYPSSDGGVWAVGRFGSRGTFLQEFAYDTGSAAGGDQRGAGCLYYYQDPVTGESQLTGQLSFEESGVGNLEVQLTYSPENGRNVTIDGMGLSGNDGSNDELYHLWSNNNSGLSMSYTRAATGTNTVSVVENRADTIVCGGQLAVIQVEALNLFTVATVEPHVQGCTVATELGDPVVDLPYEGLGILADLNGDNIPEYWQLMKSTGSGAGVTAHALFNVFTTSAAGGDLD